MRKHWCVLNTDDAINPFEVWAGKYVVLDFDDTVVGINALRDIPAMGVQRHQMGIVLASQQQQPGHAIWYGV